MRISDWSSDVCSSDLSSRYIQLHAASMTGEPKFRKKLSRRSFPKFMAEQPPAMVVMEACGSAHYWAREMTQLGHEVTLIALRYVKPFVKRKNNDAVSGTAYVFPAPRPDRRFDFPESLVPARQASLFCMTM